eukprot:2605789-Prymnesium_polylepis.1
MRLERACEDRGVCGIRKRQVRRAVYLWTTGPCAGERTRESDERAPERAGFTVRKTVCLAR